MLAIYISMLDSEEEKDKLKLIYKKYYGTMLRVAKSLIIDAALAEDAVSDAIITIIKNLHKISDVSCHKTSAYIVIIVRSCAINLLNKQKRHPVEPLDDFNSPDNVISILDDLTMKESCDNIIAHIKALPKLLSDVLYLSIVLDHSTEEISNLLNLSKDTVRQRLSRAKAQVRKMVAQEGVRHEKR